MLSTTLTRLSIRQVYTLDTTRLVTSTSHLHTHHTLYHSTTSLYMHTFTLLSHNFFLSHDSTGQYMFQYNTVCLGVRRMQTLRAPYLGTETGARSRRRWCPVPELISGPVQGGRAGAVNMWTGRRHVGSRFLVV